MHLLFDHQITMTLGVYPWPTQIWYGDNPSIHVDHWRNWCVERGVDFIDIFPQLVVPAASEVERLATLNKYYLPYDVHFNAAGNRLVADRFLEYYRNTRN